MLKKPASFVLASLNASTYSEVRLGISLAAALLTAFLNILEAPIEAAHSRQVVVVKTRAISRRTAANR
jgi:hypothetical protein